MRMILCTLGLLLLSSLPAAAQRWSADVYGGYNYTRFNTGSSSVGSLNLNGWDASLNLKPSRWFGIVSDFSGSYGSPFGPTTSFYTYLFGPQIALPARVSPFFHVLLGGARTSTAGFSDNAFATALGGGIDTSILPHISWRMVQVDYLATRFASNTQNSMRVSTGIVIHF
jgi:hypothetical protein